ncbi:MAG TPA: uroporphyrinogen decarboxylase family protein, partial [Candidatus Glassbacteria bacterium]|nr:uroporphyrinogen decarboxylase family protein [Candidatus Glassbacteria bacterium]
LQRAIGIDFEGVFGRNTMFGFPNYGWKPWRMPDGLEVLVSKDFNTSVDADGNTLIYPQGDTSAPASGRMPSGGYFFDAVIRQEPVDEERLDPADNLEEFGPVSDSDLVHYKNVLQRAKASGRALVATLGGMALGDIALVPAVFLKHPRGIRDVEEWYISLAARRDYVREVFERQTEIALENLPKIYGVLGEEIDVVFICGTDFGTQTTTFCSPTDFRELYLPYYRKINGWIHENTGWRTFKHSCGAVESFIELFIEAGFDILNPVQCSAAGMEPEKLKRRYGGRITFWGGGIDTQRVLPFGRPEEVREQVLRRLEVFSAGGGYVFNSIHNVQARTPVKNLVAMIEALHEFNGDCR